MSLICVLEIDVAALLFDSEGTVFERPNCERRVSSKP